MERTKEEIYEQLKKDIQEMNELEKEIALELLLKDKEV